MCDSGECLTVRAREGTSCTNWANRFRIRAVGKLEPVFSVSLELCGLNLQSKVHVVGCECFARIDRPPTELGVIEYFERYTDRDTLVGNAVDRDCTSPEEDGVVKRIPLRVMLSISLGTSTTIAYTGDYSSTASVIQGGTELLLHHIPE